ncbi:MAG: alanine--tRNA ligase [Bacteroidetes bacterium]|nr:MAG: alanine--tRNA ligase [Bacteroidota bacterium]
MLTSAEIRNKFLDFFKSKGHTIVPSAPIVIKNDPTLLFTNAGMNQFKDYFLGNKKPQHTRVADTQKCLRVSGKHNDLEEVGVDTYHHTMFEMLGNWSFGDYFKKDAIAWSWELLTTIYRIPEDRIYVTVFEGDKSDKIPEDDEALQEWKKWIDPSRILKGNKKDNFWEMGDTGPCGPCTEIHVDCRIDAERMKMDGQSLINADHPQVIEVWNIVFIQFNRQKDGSLQPLPAKHVDTGMGLERLVRVLQNKQSNYDTDLFIGTIAAVEQIVGKKYVAETTGDHTHMDKESIAFRVIADHIRAIAFTIADGQLPSNTGAGYVVRRILRRAVRYYYSYLQYKQPLLYQLLPVLAKQFEHVFPELKNQQDFISKVVREEEEAFLRTLEKGLAKIDSMIAGISMSSREHEGKIDGKNAFELFDTYGFPLDLTQLIAKEHGIHVDVEGFQQNMQEQKERSRAATAVDTEDWVEVRKNGASKFIGYDSLESRTRINRYRKIKSKGKEAYQIVLETTPFYAESGGQVGDTGLMQFGSESVRVIDTKKENDLIIHFTQQLPLGIDSEVVAKVDADKRKNIAVHHTATHLLHAALRQVLGTHVQQKGSLVNEEHLRFDFSHFAKLSEDEIEKIEKLVNEKIRENIPVVIKEMKKEQALQMGAMALFGEKYGDMVRVVIIDPKYSVELCGGTHVASTGELGFFLVKQETSVAAGVRRIEAVSGKSAENYVFEQMEKLQAIRELVRNPADLLKSIEALASENAELKRRIESLESKQLVLVKEQLLKQVKTVNGINFIGQQVEASNSDALKKLCFDLKSDLEDYAIVLAAKIENKASVIIIFDEELVKHKNLDASKIIKEKVAPLIKGGGGGQKSLATAGGQDPSQLQKVIDVVLSVLQ